jgi:hypothetical protein
MPTRKSGSFDVGLVSKMIDALKQAAIEEGQWSEKREAKESVSIDVFRARLNAGRDRIAGAKRADAAYFDVGLAVAGGRARAFCSKLHFSRDPSRHAVLLTD